MPEAVEQHGAAALKGLPYGDKTQLEGEETYGTGVVDDLHSAPLSQPQMPGQEDFVPPKPEPVQPVDSGLGFALNDILTAPTERPNEPITAGQRPAAVMPSQTIQSLIDAGNGTPDLQGLLNLVHGLGL